MSNPNPPSKQARNKSLAKIPRVAQQQAATMQPVDPLVAAGEKRQLEDAEFEVKLEGLHQALKASKEVHDLRKEYTNRLYSLIVVWLIFVLIYVGLSAVPSGFKLTDNVLIAFITSTTVTIVGLFVIVAKWLFPSPSKDESEKKGQKTE